MSARFLLLASLSAFLAVVLGAFGAHGLEARLSPERLATFNTGVDYHMTHSLALLAVAIYARGAPASRLLAGAGYAFLLGILVFSGSLYLLSVTGLTWLGAITPLGGVAFLAGWGCLFRHAMNSLE